MRLQVDLKPLLSLLCLGSAVLLSASTAAQPDAGSETPWLNAFDQARSEQLIQAGQRQMQIGQFETAESIFLEAMQIAKVNFGLNSTQQQLALEYAIDAQLALGKWDQADNHLSYFEWLNDEVYTRDFFDYLRGTEQLASLLLRASADTDNPLSVRYLIAAKNLNWRAVNGIEATLGESHPELAQWLYNIVQIHFYQSSLLKRGGMSNTIYRNENDEEVSGWTLNLGDSMRISYRIGKELLQRIEAIHEQAETSPAESAAIAVIYQGDWEMLFGNQDDALRLYGRAYAKLIESGLTTEQADQLFARPTVIPASELHTSFAAMTEEEAEGPLLFRAWTPNYPAAPLPSDHVAVNVGPSSQITALLRFDLHPLLPSNLISSGRTIRLGFNLADLEVLNSSPDNALVRERARREVSLLQFRPKLKNGAPVQFENIELEYRFAPQYSNFRLSGN